MKTIELAGADGIQLAADADGDESNRSVILLHGGGQTRHAWGNALTALAADGWHAVTVDLRGHGQSSWSSDGVYSLDRFASDVRIVAQQFDLPVLVGASLGGLSSLAAIGESQEPIASALVLVDVTPRLEQEGVKRITEFMSLGVNGFESLAAVADAVASYLPHRRRPSDLEGLKKNVRRREDGKWVWHWDPAFISGVDEQAGEPTSGRFSPRDRLQAAARRVTIPTLLVRGGASDVVSKEGAAELKALIPHAEVVDVADAGHMVAGDRNDRFNSAVIDFLDRIVR